MTILQDEYRCPSCWAKFRPEEVLWIATSEELGEDPQLKDTIFEGANVNKSKGLRFLPRRFTPDGDAIDAGGGHCSIAELACPVCHLGFPEAYLHSQSLMVSLVGGSGTGKSYLLASLVKWMSIYFSRYGIIFQKTFAGLTEELNVSVERLYAERTAGKKFARIDYSQDMHNSVDVKLPDTRDKDTFRETTLIEPYMYSINRRGSEQLFSLCLYDHAGEDFKVGASDRDRLAYLTGHLGFTDALIFLYDPTQNRRFVEDYKKVSKDENLYGAERYVAEMEAEITAANDPVAIFNEMKRRILAVYRKEDGSRIRGAEQYDHPVVIAVTKCDAWQCLKPELEGLLKEYPDRDKDGRIVIDSGKIREVSNVVRDLLLEYRPEFVNTVNAFASDVVFIPISATGQQPTEKDDEGKDAYLPGSLKPIWIGVPLLYALAKHKAQLVEIV